MKAWRKPEQSVLWPVVRAVLSNDDGVDRADLGRASVETASSSGITASLTGG